MSRREDIDSAIWDDDEFLDLSDAEKVVYIWAFTNSRIGMAGLYRVSRRSIQTETGKAGAELDAILARLAKERFCFYEDGVMWVRSRIKHLRTKSPTIAKAIRSDIAKLEGHPLTDRLRDEYSATAWVFGDVTQTPIGPIDDPSIPHASPIDPPSRGSGQGRAGQGRVKKNNNDGRASSPQVDDWPDRLPEPARFVAAQVHRRLTDVAQRRGSAPPTKARVGDLVADHPNFDHATILGQFADYWLHGKGATKPRKDWVATYRNWLSNCQPTSTPTAAGAPGAVDLDNDPRALAEAMNKSAARFLTDTDPEVVAGE